MFILIFGIPNCIYCIKAKKLARNICSKNINFLYKYVDIIKKNIKKKSLFDYIDKNIYTFPQIFINNKHIGGFDNFCYYLKKKKIIF
ncbi:MAG: GrxA family glutaredoxin [Enterobacteriaceae bacterium]